jgi:hypothetical protein
MSEVTLIRRQEIAGGVMDQRLTPKRDVAALVARRVRNKEERVMKLAIVRYRHLKSLSEIASDASERVKLYEKALMCLANSAENVSDGPAFFISSATAPA